jgi:uncharacterized repeat protein (TIGR02543 family)
MMRKRTALWMGLFGIVLAFGLILSGCSADLPSSVKNTITFDADGGTVTPTSKQVISGDPAGDLPVPTKSNNTFDGWYTAQNGEGTLFTSTTIVDVDITVYAKWTEMGDNNNDNSLLIASITTYLAEQSGGSSIDDPVNLSFDLQLTSANTKAIFTAIWRAEKYVVLDLALCTCSDQKYNDRAHYDEGLFADGFFDLDVYPYLGRAYVVSLILPNATRYIMGVYGFFDVLTSVSLPASVHAYGLSSFAWNPSVTSFILTGEGPLSTIEEGRAVVQNGTDLLIYPSASGDLKLDNITNIGYLAFASCHSLVSVNLPMVTEINQAVFIDCTSLISVDIPMATKIGPNAFNGCTSLTSVNFPVVTEIGSGAFRDCTSLPSVSFPMVTEISSGAFMDCTSLSSVNIPKVAIIHNYAFEGCISLVSVDFPMVTEIGRNAFEGCTSLTSVRFPEVIFIGDNAFSHTGTIALTIVFGSEAPECGDGQFGGVKSAKIVTIKVPFDATGYGTIPQTYSDVDTQECWGNGFRGAGWVDTEFSRFHGSVVNSNITLHVAYQDYGE